METDAAARKFFKVPEYMFDTIFVFELSWRIVI